MSTPRTTSCKLLCDHREHAVTVHATEWSAVGVQYHVGEYNTGDYAIIDSTGRLLAVFERKTLDDFGASIKDGRHDNKHKLVAIAAQTGCRIVYIIESADWPRPSDTYARIPYRAIESAIFHLIIRDNICVLRTRNSLDTAQTLARFVLSCDTLLSRSYIPDAPALATTSAAASTPAASVGSGVIADAVGASAADAAVPATIDVISDHVRLLAARHAKPDADVVRAMWSKFRGITAVTADEYINIMSLRDLFTGTGAGADVTALRLSNGKRPPSRAFTSISHIDSDTEARVLSAIPGISMATARTLAKIGLRRLLTYDVGAISIIKIPSKGAATMRNLGTKNAERITHYFGYRHPPAHAPANAVADSAGAPASAFPAITHERVDGIVRYG